MTIPSRLKSRKLFMTLLGFGMTTLLTVFQFPHELIHVISKTIEILVPTYVGSQGIVDATLHVATAINDATSDKNS